MAVRVLTRRVQTITGACGALLGFVLMLQTACAQSQAIDPPRAVPIIGFSELVEQVAPAVVNVSTSRARAQQIQPDGNDPVPEGESPFDDFFEDFFNRESPLPTPNNPSSLGSGFVIDPRGFVVTNNHVVGEGRAINVVFNDDTSYEAELIGRDPKTDLALLKIEAEDSQPFPFLGWADSSEVKVGEWMVAIGNPFGFGSSVTAGIVSALSRDIRSGPYDDYLQIDAPINRGNSGGPSFNLSGEVIGVNTAIFSPSGGNVGIGFAIPANLAKPVINSLMEYGRVRRGWLGVRIQSVNEEIAEGFGLPEASGALVAGVSPDGPAEDAGLQQGDVIVTFDGKKVERMRSLPRIVAETEIDARVAVEYWRRGQQRQAQVTVGELPEDDTLLASTQQEVPQDNQGGAGLSSRIGALGLRVVQLSDALRDENGIAADASGVFVTEVDEAGPASGIVAAGDVIAEINQEVVGSPPELSAKINEALRAERNSVLLLINRDGDMRFEAIRVE